MQILAEDYKVIKNRGKLIVFNSLYESSSMAIFISAILQVFLPDIRSFYIPLAIEINTDDDNISIDKNLRVHGTSLYSYFVPKEHYYKWKKTYKVVFETIIFLETAVSLLLLYIFLIRSRYNILVGLAFIIVFSMTLALLSIFLKQSRLIKKYEIKEMMINIK